METNTIYEFDDFQFNEDEEFEEDGCDALNDETFGSAAVNEDWEENHEQFARLTETARIHQSINKDIETNVPDCYLRNDSQNVEEDAIEASLRNISFDDLNHKRLFEHNSVGSPLDHIQNEFSSSPGHSIWSPTPDLDFLKKQSQVTGIQKANFNQPPQTTINGVQPQKNILSSFKTVSELEDEMKRGHAAMHKMGTTVQDLERNLVHRPNERGGPMSQTFPGAQMQQRMWFNNANQANMGPAHQRPLLNTPYHFNNVNVRAMQGNNFHRGFPFDNQMHHMRGERPMHPFQQQQQHQQHRMMGARPQNYPRNLFDSNYHPKNHQNRSNQNTYNDNHRDMNASQEGRRIRRDSDVEWDEWQRKRESDEYSGLMTPREKSWLRNIQSLQLQTENPYETDYYYVMFKLRQHKKREEEAIEINGRQMMSPGKNDSEYIPPRLENSLGKLQVVNVNAPRKIIDLQVVHLDSNHPTTSLQRDMRKHRQLLLRLEKLYEINIEIDDLERKMRALPDCPTRDLFRSKCGHLIKKLWLEITTPHESFVQLLCIRKGKSLVGRFMHWLEFGDVEHVLATTIQNWSLLSKKDSQEKKLSMFWPCADRFFSVCPALTLSHFGLMVVPHLQSQKNNVIPMLSNRLGLSMVLRLLVRGDQLWSDLEGEASWHQFLRAVIQALSCLTSEALSNVEPLPSVSLMASFRQTYSHLTNCKDVEMLDVNRAVDLLKIVESTSVVNSNFSNSSAK